ncbi:16S rRNA (cytosine(967)-C(5))-methyltransferase RsmB [Metabacillus arenae]|uniref:16S rRNA (cytosine(967)-C(5))-methyltransferase n=1 Tax=Metabacillus arenae TaxID=2771434 RepID=A0A926RWK2_9BACI|nr:16S rRNA (cytosine(967)-C(5))-methyltransferase RsmB [Metabacillus arenae]MBD1379996.1 16S rRNA (cytosine(967)-C(5))-methyltransferase RsmB [Metabacillus arenae]
MKKANVREVAVEALLKIEKNQAFSNLLLNSLIKSNQLDAKDVPLLTELVYGTLQRKMTLDYILSKYLQKPKKVEDWVKVLLRMSIYQMVYLDRIPDRAILFEAVEIAKRKGHRGISSFVNGILRNFQREGMPSFDEITNPVERISIESSHPKWLVEKWMKQYGEETTAKMCQTNLLPPVQTARVNKMKSNESEVIELLSHHGITAEKGDLAIDAIKSRSGNVALTDAFKQGYLTVQDESSMLVGRALGATRGDIILDACAAPGGKTTHIAELLEQSGKVYSLDLHEHKVKLIKDQAKRLELTNIEARTVDARKASNEFQEESFDRILVDAPCSGFGVIRRKPDIKYTKNANDIKMLAKIQYDILSSVSPLLKKGGTLVYSTCTIDKEENNEVVDTFIQNHPEFEADHSLAKRLPDKIKPYIKNGQLQILPHYFNTDGFYIASMRKKV